MGTIASGRGEPDEGAADTADDRADGEPGDPNDGVGDVEPCLGREAPRSVERPDERRVDPVERDDDRDEAELVRAVLGLEERGDDRCGQEEAEAGDPSEDRVDAEHSPERRLLLRLRGGRDGVRHALDRAPDGDVVDQVQRGEDPLEVIRPATPRRKVKRPSAPSRAP